MTREMQMPARRMSPFGTLLRSWRELRHLSQLELALEANVSARHISFVETGRANPSREMVLMLASVLDVPLREQNAMLHAAGFAPAYRETSLTDPQMAQVRQALELILRQQEPFPALVFDRNWDLLMANAAYARLITVLSGRAELVVAPYVPTSAPRLNVLRAVFAPDGWRPFFANWEALARQMLARWHREAGVHGDPAHQELLAEVLRYPDVPARWHEPDLASPPELVVPVELRLGEQTLTMFSTITTLGSPQDITLQELRIEAFHPVDDATEQLVRALAEPANR